MVSFRCTHLFEIRNKSQGRFEWYFFFFKVECKIWLIKTVFTSKITLIRNVNKNLGEISKMVFKFLINFKIHSEIFPLISNYIMI
ncbi:hypothetical protein CO054_02310 [Candidatus Shapirobacteria bacterium CG_4_9_14_0_2_um_filter_39_11]|uniref:Uncharacterized protein n=1 Tax=Candidatus Shapirobacteria bacterium CG_4_9_14_0_2_um_filter_39_11 TaxID=1974478 RepID=A0A2M8ESE4_9BACT|nr:MAG: hypothetical protein CO054_02310 [Candidatus Shapirobacteria bacterium CG_4_9_14_0_2_um_filter_39_11]